MTQLYIPSKQILAPELFIPGHKPVGFVEIDWSNTLTNSLHSAYLWSSFNPIDIAGRVPNSALTVTGSAVELGYIPNSGRSLIFDGTASNQIDIADSGETYVFHNDVSGEYSILYILTHDGTDRADEFTLSTNAASLDLVDNLTISDSTILDGKEHQILITWKVGTNGFKAYIDGELIGQVNATAGAAECHLHRYENNGGSEQLELFWGTVNDLRDLMVAGASQKTTDRWAGGMIATYFWHRALTPQEAFSLSIEPYQIFKPVGPEWLPINIPAAGGGLSIPVAMHHYTKNIGQ